MPLNTPTATSQQNAPTIWHGYRDCKGIAHIQYQDNNAADPQPFNPPAEYEWGYAGAGPSRLARDILLHHTQDKDLATQLQYDFTQEIISRLPYSGWSITSDQIDRWLKKRQSQTTQNTHPRQLAA